MRHTLRLTTLLGLSLLLTAGCGGGGSSSNASGASAAATTSQHVVLNLSQARAEHTATLLPNGDIFVAGGVDFAGNPVDTTAIVNRTSVRPGPTLQTPRRGHTATLLPNGQLLIAGGITDAQAQTVTRTTEVYDYLTDSLSPGPDLTTPRAHHAAHDLDTPNGRQILLAGGVDFDPTAQRLQPMDSAELVDSALTSSSPLAQPLPAPTSRAQAALLSTGRVLIVSEAGAAVFDPQTNAFSPSPLVANRDGASLSTLNDEALIAGGASQTGLEDSTEVFDAQTQTSAQGVRIGAPRRDIASATAGAKVVLTGGTDANGTSNALEILEGSPLGQATHTTKSPLKQARVQHTVTALDPNTIVVIGGYDGTGAPHTTYEVIDLRPAATPVPTGGSGSGLTGGAGLVGPGATGTTSSGGGSGGSTPITGGTGSGTTGSGTTGSGSTGSGSTGGLAGLLGGLFGAGSGSSGGTSTNTLINAVIQSALSALTGPSSSTFSGFMQAFTQNLLTNLLGGGSTSSSGLSGLLGGLLGSLTGSGSGSSGASSSSGLAGILSGLLGGLGGSSSGTPSGSSGGLAGLLSGLLGTGSSGSAGSGSGSSSGGLAGLLSGLLGGSSGGSAATPAVSALTPGQGAVGDTVLISGTNFGTQASVTFNGVAATVTSVNQIPGGNTIVAVTVPAGATSGAVLLTTNGTTVNAGAFIVL